MSKRLSISEEEKEWLQAHHRDYSHADLAKRYDVCADTIKRLLVRLDLQTFSGAKYARKVEVLKWRRPCMRCGCDAPRPVGQYRCSACHERERSADGYYDDPTPKHRVRLPSLPRPLIKEIEAHGKPAES